MDAPACAGFGVAGGRGGIFVLYVIATVASYEQLDNSEKLASKNAYLAALPRAVSALSPDIVVILFDDLGYGDVGFTGNRSIRTPYMDTLAENGVVMTNYFSPAPVCSPSRAAMLTGRMAPRNGLTAVPFPSGSLIDQVNRFFGNPVRLPREEIIIPEVLKATGFHTAMVGKWHLGDHDKSIPTEFGFDRFFGTYHSNDMTPFHLVEGVAGGEKIAYPPLLIKPTECPLRSKRDNCRGTDGHTLFLYLRTIFHMCLCSANEQGRSEAGLYGDGCRPDDTVVRYALAVNRQYADCHHQ